MAERVRIEQTALPGIGVRQELSTESGRRVGVLSHRIGRRDLLVFSVEDPDACTEVVELTDDEADALAEILGGPRIMQRLADLHEQAAALVTEQVPIATGSRFDGRVLADTQMRTRTGASIVAVLRRGEVIVSPRPDFVFTARDVVLIVGTREGTTAGADILTG